MQTILLMLHAQAVGGKPSQSDFEPSEFGLNHIGKDKAKLKVIRSRSSDISWWVRLLSQNIAQRANKEDARSAAERIASSKASTEVA